MNRLVPEADRAVGEVTEIGRGRHTSTQSVALPLETDGQGGGWVIDTPGIRSLGLAHIQPDDVLLAFTDLAEAIGDCPRGCGHMGRRPIPNAYWTVCPEPRCAAWQRPAGC
ncbi:hypothetical protein I551_4062 [Mycobacterium ulcerans str. Harvey]|uniref:EngC GTPase domain-containing protein n=1 Tax=Mycobacterium ulcerans str. Harvey TaxID=1299332 RepID=A0ABP3ADU1_MYCUL|nr:hypothetical protein I551_4062 [Mycobacterium ulcerans str. Harvey]